MPLSTAQFLKYSLLASTIAIFSLGMFNAWLSIQFLSRQQLDKQAQVILENLEDILHKEDLELEIKQLAEFPSVVWIHIYKQNGDLIAKSPNKKQALVFTRAKKIQDPQGKVHHLRVGFTTTALNAQVWVLFWILLITLICLLLTTIWIQQHTLKNHLARPINQILQAMQDISAGKYTIRLPKSRFSDLQTISKHVLELAAAVNSREKLLQTHTHAVSQLAKAEDFRQLVRTFFGLLQELEIKEAAFKIHNHPGVARLEQSTAWQLRDWQYGSPPKQAVNWPLLYQGQEFAKLEIGPQFSDSTIFALLEASFRRLFIRRQASQREWQLNLARLVQQSLIPSQVKTYSQVELEFFHKPQEQLGGDWFYFKEEKDKGFYLLIGDVTGHGLSSSLVSTAVSATIHTIETSQQTLHPDTTMNILNSLLLRISGDSKLHMSCIIAYLDYSTGTLEICNAGHHFPLILQEEGKPQVLNQNQQEILGLNTTNYKRSTYFFPANTTLLLYTDGLLDARNSGGKRFARVLMPLLKKTQNLKPKALQQEILQSLEEYPATDDVCMFLLSWK